MCVCSVVNCTPLLIQQNDGSGSMNRSWTDYKVGFGDPGWRELRGNYWLGNDLLSGVTATPCYTLRFQLQSRHNGNWYNAEYSRFRVLSEADDYTVQVGGYSGNTTFDAFYMGHATQKFSTFDRQNTNLPFYNPAAVNGGGWWYRYSGRTLSVNGARSVFGLFWFSLDGGSFLQRTQMWLKCKGSP